MYRIIIFTLLVINVLSVSAQKDSLAKKKYFVTLIEENKLKQKGILYKTTDTSVFIVERNGINPVEYKCSSIYMIKVHKRWKPYLITGIVAGGFLGTMILYSEAGDYLGFGNSLVAGGVPGVLIGGGIAALSGKELFKTIFSGYEQEEKISGLNLSNGIFMYRIIANGIIIQQDKLTVIK